MRGKYGLVDQAPLRPTEYAGALKAVTHPLAQRRGAKRNAAFMVQHALIAFSDKLRLLGVAKWCPIANTLLDYCRLQEHPSASYTVTVRRTDAA